MKHSRQCSRLSGIFQLYSLPDSYCVEFSSYAIHFFLSPRLLFLFLLPVYFIRDLLPRLQPFLQHLPPYIFWSLHSVMSLTSSPSSLPNMCPYYLNLASLTFTATSTTPHLLISSFHNVSGQLSFISSYVSVPSQPCFPHLYCNIYHPTSSDLFIP